MARILRTNAREVFDSRGNPTLEVQVALEDGCSGVAIVPAGASTGTHEAAELRDGELNRYHGKGVTRAVKNVEWEIPQVLVGLEASNQTLVDQTLIQFDRTPNKRRLGANAILGVSIAVARAAANSARLPLYRYLGGAAANELPVPLVNIISGGIHGGGNIDFQDFMMIPLRAKTYSAALADVNAVYRAAKEVLRDGGVYRAGVADEGGYAPALESNESGFSIMVEAIERAGLEPGRDAAIAVDVAASHFCERGRYHLQVPDEELSADGLVERLASSVDRYPILSIEDGLDEDDWDGWLALTGRLGDRCLLIGDDLFVTNADRLERGIEQGIANAVLVKINQIGTLTETLDVVSLARRNGYQPVISARSGETEDDFIADLAVAAGASLIKVGAITRSERLAKYNRLVRIEQELGSHAVYRGEKVFAAVLEANAGSWHYKNRERRANN
ncbi:MAG: phosphopyruvate hydratase [Acidobacteria bacterium]|nr:MAG: phosphopyruvate hydratase [Acidobacteriota bacterium]